MTDWDGDVSRRPSQRRQDELNPCVSIALGLAVELPFFPKRMRFAHLVLILLACAPMGAATLERLTIEDMAQNATAVVRGQVGESHADRFGALVYTLHAVEVQEQWTGEAIADLEVAVPGGTYQGLTYRFGGTPELVPGTNYVLFLWTGPSGRTQIIGLSQGVFEIVESPDGPQVVRNPVGGTSFVAKSDGADEERIRMSLAKLATRVQAALAEAKD